MDDSELFDVFSLDNNPEPEQKTVSVPVTEDLKKPKPSKVPSQNGSTSKRSYDRADDASDERNGSHSPPASKKARKNVEDPVVVDSFETESDQVVPATQGLQGTAPEDQNIVIKKRVSFTSNSSLTFSTVMLLYFLRQIGNIRLWNLTSSWTLRREPIDSS